MVIDMAVAVGKAPIEKIKEEQPPEYGVRSRMAEAIWEVEHSLLVIH